MTREGVGATMGNGSGVTEKLTSVTGGGALLQLMAAAQQLW